MEQLRNIFLEADEKQITVLGNRYIQSFLRTGREEGSFCIVSNYRLYIKGLLYKKVGKRYRKCRESQIMELSQVHSCNRMEIKHWNQNIPAMEIDCDGQTFAVPIQSCTEYESAEFQKHLRMAMAYERRR